MEEIAQEAGITKPILYDHFRDKAGLASALTERVAELVRARTLGSLLQPMPARQLTYEGIHAFLQFVEEEPQLYEFMAQAARTGSANQTQRQLVVTLASDIAGRIRAALSAAGSDPAKATPWSFAIIGAIMIAGEWWLAAPGSTTAQQLAEDLTTLIWSGLDGIGLEADLVPGEKRP